MPEQELDIRPTIRLPLAGTCLLSQPATHDRYAFDLVNADDGSEQPHDASQMQWFTVGLSVERFHSWHAPVLAPIGGVVTSVVNDLPDKRRSHRLLAALDTNVIQPRRHRSNPIKQAGNHIVINGGNAYAVLAHLSDGSAMVEPGEEVEAGQVIALVGNSGTSLSSKMTDR
jgi:hypothetical protein